ncbi:MAG: penicillin-binding transpeptidase domain-containing protein [Actinomycetota bacterium]|nr:penicillin-binding transpeptidase domain-containing protein [Actinomycetota bacterium]
MKRRRRRTRRLARGRPTRFERRPLPVRPRRRRSRPKKEKRTGAGGGRAGAHLGLRLSVIAAVVVGLFAVLVLRLWSIQVIGYASARSQAIQIFTTTVPIQPPRGSIVARDGQVLAKDKAEYVVTLSCPTSQRSLCPEQDAGVIARLAPLLGETVSQIDAAVTSNQIGPFAPAPVAVGVPFSVVAYVAEHQSEFPGVSEPKTYLRTYPQQALASQVVGYVGSITAPEYARYSAARYSAYGYVPQDTQFGQSGLEQQYELALHGRPGVSTIEVNAVGQDVGTRSTVEPTPGDEVVLNMDLPLERVVTNDLANQVAALRAGTIPGGAQPAPYAAAAVIDPRNGHVLALASYPGYNDNVWVPAISDKAYKALTPPAVDAQPLVDYAVSNGSPPGSTFKLATATAALQDGLITPYDYVVDTGTFTVGNITLHDAGGEVLGPVNVTSALAESSDIFFYTMGQRFWDAQSRYGLMPIQHMAALYGLGVPSGIDLPNVSAGQVDSPALRRQLHALNPAAYPSTSYYVGDNVEMAFGQGETLLTPLEIANAYATFANGGTRYAPEMAAALVSPNGTVRRVPPKIVDHVTISSTNYQAMLQGFEGALANPKGTAYAEFVGFPFSKWLIAGKTGTATITHTAPPTSWFVAFGGPKGQSPRYAVAVEIAEAGYGAQASAPVVREVLDYLYAHGVAPLRLPGSGSTLRAASSAARTARTGS